MTIGVDEMRLKLIEIRNKRNKTQQQIADFVGVTRTAISNYETGTSTPRYYTAQKIKEFLKYSKDDLFLNSDVKLNDHDEESA